MLSAHPFVPPAVPDEPAEIPCCMGSIDSQQKCCCWEPVYDLEQQPLVDGGVPPAEVPTRSKCCQDCAYRQGSPERADEYLAEELERHPFVDGEEFWCHQGVRRVVAYRHPDGRVLPAGEGDYRPPIGPEERPVIWRADGTVGERCAGWAALHRARGRIFAEGFE